MWSIVFIILILYLNSLWNHSELLSCHWEYDEVGEGNTHLFVYIKKCALILIIDDEPQTWWMFVLLDICLLMKNRAGTCWRMIPSFLVFFAIHGSWTMLRTSFVPHLGTISQSKKVSYSFVGKVSSGTDTLLSTIAINGETYRKTDQFIPSCKTTYW